MRYLLLLLLTFSFNTFSQVPDPSYGLPELASEERIRELNTKKRYINKDELPGAYIAISCIYD